MRLRRLSCSYVGSSALTSNLVYLRRLSCIPPSPLDHCVGPANPPPPKKKLIIKVFFFYDSSITGDPIPKSNLIANLV